jgi:hypothetical protein
VSNGVWIIHHCQGFQCSCESILYHLVSLEIDLRCRIFPCRETVARCSEDLYSHIYLPGVDEQLFQTIGQKMCFHGE